MFNSFEKNVFTLKTRKDWKKIGYQAVKIHTTIYFLRNKTLLNMLQSIICKKVYLNEFILKNFEN